jgi:hypothetical protein
MIEALQSIFDQVGLDLGLDKAWERVSRSALVGWLIFYVVFLGYAFAAHGGFLFIDMANLVVHEGGHNLFGWFGPTLVPVGRHAAAVAGAISSGGYFFTKRQTAGFVFCLFFFFENWLYTATYMADARALVLPLVTTGDPEFARSTTSMQSSRVSACSTTTRQIAAVVSDSGLVRNDRHSDLACSAAHGQKQAVSGRHCIGRKVHRLFREVSASGFGVRRRRKSRFPSPSSGQLSPG